MQAHPRIRLTPITLLIVPRGRDYACFLLHSSHYHYEKSCHGAVPSPSAYLDGPIRNGTVRGVSIEHPGLDCRSQYLWPRAPAPPAPRCRPCLCQNVVHDRGVISKRQRSPSPLEKPSYVQGDG